MSSMLSSSISGLMPHSPMYFIDFPIVALFIGQFQKADSPIYSVASPIGSSVTWLQPSNAESPTFFITLLAFAVSKLKQPPNALEPISVNLSPNVKYLNLSQFQKAPVPTRLRESALSSTRFLQPANVQSLISLNVFGTGNFSATRIPSKYKLFAYALPCPLAKARPTTGFEYPFAKSMPSHVALSA